MTIVAVTGHRSEDAESEDTVRTKFRDAFHASGASVVIVGMANGADLWAGDVALDLGLEVWAARPWRTHGPRRGDEALYARVIEGASRVVDVVDADTYPGPWAYHRRNEWMVDHADELLAYWSGKKKGGTFACVNYCKAVQKEWTNVYV